MASITAGVIPGLNTPSAYVVARGKAGTQDAFQVLTSLVGPASLSFAEQAFVAGWLLEEHAPGVYAQVNVEMTEHGKPVLEVFSDTLYLRPETTVREVQGTEDAGYEHGYPATVGTRYLWSRLITLIQTGGLDLSETKDGGQLYQAIRAQNWRSEPFTGEHRSLLQALALAVMDNSGPPGALFMDVDPFDAASTDVPDPDDPYRVFWDVPTPPRPLKKRFQ